MENENWILCRKPLSEKSIADNVLKWGTGGINIEKSRIGFTSEDAKTMDYSNRKVKLGFGDEYVGSTKGSHKLDSSNCNYYENNTGRFPANFIYSGDDEVLEEFDKAGISKGTNRIGFPKGTTFGGGKMDEKVIGKWFGDEGSAARFFYNTKDE